MMKLEFAKAGALRQLFVNPELESKLDGGSGTTGIIEPSPLIPPMCWKPNSGSRISSPIPLPSSLAPALESTMNQREKLCSERSLAVSIAGGSKSMESQPSTLPSDIVMGFNSDDHSPLEEAETY